MRATIPFPLHRCYAAAAQLGFLPGYRPILDEFPRHEPALDVGCGPGDVAIRLAQVQKVVGVDIDPRMIKMAKRRHGDHADCRFEVADVADLPFPDDHFGAAWTSESFHHWEEPEKGLAEVFRVLQPGAQFWIVEARADMTRDQFRRGFGLPALPGLYGGLRLVFRKHGVTDEGAHGVRALMHEAGFEVELRPHGAWMVFIGTKPKRARKGPGKAGTTRRT